VVVGDHVACRVPDEARPGLRTPALALAVGADEAAPGIGLREHVDDGRRHALEQLGRRLLGLGEVAARRDRARRLCRIEEAGHVGLGDERRE